MDLQWRTGESRWTTAIGVALALVVAAGWIGAARYLHDLGGPSAWHDELYFVLQALTLQLDPTPPEDPYPVLVEIVRLVGPIVLGAAVLRALAFVFRDAADELVRARWIAWRRPVTIICGLGEVGGAVMRRMRPDADEPGAGHRRPNRVVAIEADRALGDVDEARRRRVPVIFGSATDPRTWRRARLHRAEQVLVACGDDELNGEAVAVVRSLMSRRPTSSATPLRVAVHLAGEGWADLQRRVARPVDGLQEHAFCLGAPDAGRLLALHPPFAPADPGVPQVLVVGTGPLAEAVIARAAQIWSTTGPGRTGERLRIEVVGVDIEAFVGALRARAHDLDAVVDLRVVELPRVAPAEVVAAAGRWTRAYVCLDHERTGLEVALALADAGAGGPPIVTQAGRSSGLAELVLGPPSRGRPVVAVSPFELVADEISVFRRPEDWLARQAHEAYLGLMASFPEPGRDTGDESLRAWDDLTDEVKAANRAQVEGMAANFALVGIGATLLPLRGVVVPVQLDDDELLAVAEAEHERWMAAKLAAGHRRGSRGRPGEHPDLVPWGQLDESARRKDVEAVLSHLRALASLGCRLPPRASQGARGTPGWERRVVAA